METLLTRRENLQAQLDVEWINYRNAIKTDKPFDEAKAIYMRIKDLQTQIVDITSKIRLRLKIGD